MSSAASPRCAKWIETIFATLKAFGRIVVHVVEDDRPLSTGCCRSSVLAVTFVARLTRFPACCDMLDFIVIGKGLFGSAAFRYLSEATRSVAVIGPDEPIDYATHDGVFASHYDEGRHVGRLGKDFTWTQLTTSSIDQYSSIEERSGIPFYASCGRLTVVPGTLPTSFLKRHAEVARVFGVLHESLTASTIRQRFPMFCFPRDYSAAFEPAPAGLIRPRALIRGQLAIGVRNGATVIRDEVHAVRVSDDLVTVRTRGGQRHKARCLLLANGAFANCFNLLERKLALRVKTETNLLAEVPEGELARLRSMPTLSYSIDSPSLSGVYVTPPLRYPDGRFYIKFGCDTAADEVLYDLSAMQAWMRRGRLDCIADTMLQALLTLMPGVDIHGSIVRPCLVTYTPHGKPFVDQLNPRVFIASGGNGASAQCSDALGHLAARLLLDERWPEHYQRHDFRVMYADESDRATC